MVNTPIPHSLKSESKKAAKILREFTMPNSKTGPDKLIPAGILCKAKGLAIITVFKAGFLVTARGGSGIVIAKLDSDSFDYATGWSAPSAIGLAGLGGGFELGMEVTDFVIILTSKAAVDAFSKGGNLTLGGNFTIAAGPLGRNLEGDIAVRSPAAIYTYSKTKGIFAGISVEGSALIERKDANKKFYGRVIRASQILQGDVDPPEECQALYAVMKEHQEMAARAALKLAKSQALKHKDEARDMLSAEVSHRYGVNTDSWASKSRKQKSPSPESNKPTRTQSEWALSSASYSSSSKKSSSPSSSSSSSQAKSVKQSWSSTSFKGKSFKSSKAAGDSARTADRKGRSERSKSITEVHDPWAAYDEAYATEAPEIWARADYTFQGQLSCDLSFKAGDRIKVTLQTGKQDDWWEGIDARGEQGIFPANFVTVL